MRFARLVSVALLLGAVDANVLFRENKPAYEGWNLEETRNFLVAQGVKVKDSATIQDLHKEAAKHADAASNWVSAQASQASADAAAASARVAASVKGIDSQIVDAWDESQLREWLLEQGIISPASKPEQLRILAKHKVSRLSSAVFGGPTDHAKASVESAASEVSSHASAAAGMTYNWASGKLDDTRDYVFSKWDNSDLEDWLEVHGVIKPNPVSRNGLLAAVREAYTKTLTPIYDSWETSTIRQWLIDHHVVPTPKSRRDELLEMMRENYYGASDKVYTAWDDNKLRKWLVDEGVLSTSSPDLKHDKYIKLMDEHYEQSKKVIWSAWSDSDMHTWLVDRGIIRSSTPHKRNELISYMEKEYKDKTRSPYLAWPDAHIRAQLRSYGVDDKKIVGRTSLLQEMRVHYVESENAVTKIVKMIQDYIEQGVALVTATINGFLGDVEFGAKSADDTFKRGMSLAAAGLDRAISSASSVHSAHSRSINSAVTAISESVSKSIEHVRSDAQASLDAVSHKLAHSYASASSSAESDGHPSIESFASSLSKRLSSDYSSASNSAQEAENSASSKAAQLYTDATKSSHTVMSSYSKEAASAAASASTLFVQATNSLSSAYSVASKNAASAAANVKKEL
ncbi:hypothetical protein CspHIS471_0205900 [Cutaneotrichosporon sp. HIS471]|nr:hypothetical protein CspHIS471_0205900 [Cutaneotrichosporon sp. HIS471]